MQYHALLSNIVDITVKPAPTSEEAGRIVNWALSPKSVVQGNDTKVTAEAIVPGDAKVQLRLFWTDTHAELARLEPVHRPWFCRLRRSIHRAS
jgi:hypothetical protein